LIGAPGRPPARACRDSAPLLTINVTTITESIAAVRIPVDHRIILDWNEIDAVKLVGRR